VRSPKKLLFRLMLVLGGLLVGLGLSEVVARLFGPMRGEDLLFNAPDASPRGMYRSSATLFQEPVPGFEGTSAAMGYRVALRFSTYGLRGPDEVGPPPRWLALGDSFTLAAQVPEEATFESLLGQKESATVLNAGVDGYSTWQELTRYRDLDDRLGTSLALVVFFLGNDLYDNERIRAILAHPPPPGAGPQPRGVGSNAISRWLFRHSVLAACGRVAWRHHALYDPKNPDLRRYRDELEPFTQAGAQRLSAVEHPTEEALVAFRTETESRGDQLVVALAPPAFAMSSAETGRTLSTVGMSGPLPDAPRDALLHTLGRLGIHACDLTPALRESFEAKRAPYLRFNGHWSVEGHEVVATSLATCIDGWKAGSPANPSSGGESASDGSH
jgi:hypothetical protein